MSVSAILSEKGREVVTGTPGTTLESIAKTLSEKHIGAIVIVESDGRVCGIASERDIIHQIAGRGAAALKAPISSCMTQNVIACRESDSVDSVMTTMTQHRFRHLPVIEDGKLAGIVSIGDVVKRKIEQAERDAEELKRYIAG